MKVHQKRLLDKGKIEKLIKALRVIRSSNSEVAQKIRTEADYFRRNAERMSYPKFRKQFLFVGSGVIEAGCKTVIGSRLKQSGMFWTVRGANAILARRCCHLNGHFEDYWDFPSGRLVWASLLCRAPNATLRADYLWLNVTVTVVPPAPLSALTRTFRSDRASIAVSVPFSVLASPVVPVAVI